MSAVLGIDPGTRKCGYAVVSPQSERPLALGITELPGLAALAAELLARFALGEVALGGGTHAGEVAQILAALGLPVRLVDERNTTYLARARYFADHPPRGWRRLAPLGMLVPPRPIDDYAALIIAERHLATQASPTSC